MKNKLCIVLSISLCALSHASNPNIINNLNVSSGNSGSTLAAMVKYSNTPTTQWTIFSGLNRLIDDLKPGPLFDFVNTDLSSYSEVASYRRACSQAIVKDMMDAIKPYLWCALGIGIGLYILHHYLDPYWKVYKIRKKQELLKQFQAKKNEKAKPCIIL